MPTLDEYRKLIGYQIKERPVRTYPNAICQWLTDNEAQFQFMISIMFSYKTTQSHYRSVVRQFMQALSVFRPLAEFSYFVAYENHPVCHIHLFINSHVADDDLFSFIRAYCERQFVDAVIKPYYSINGISYALKSITWDRDFEYDFSHNIFTVKKPAI
jgi:hypothetical protein